MSNLRGKRVLVAGGGGGMGGAVALQAAKAGASVLLFGRNRESLERRRSEISAESGQRVETFVGDAARASDAEGCVAMGQERFGGVDVLVNAVGVNIRERSLEKLTKEGWSTLVEGNLGVAYSLTQAVLPTFRQQREGLLVHISSVAALRADGSGVGYQATKAAVSALARATMFEERSNGVRVSVIYPGLTDTTFASTRPVPPSAEELERALQPEDVADVCISLMALPARSYVPDLTVLPSRL